MAARTLGDGYPIRVLKALFLLKWVREFKATPQNIAILLIDRSDIKGFDRNIAPLAALIFRREIFVARVRQLRVEGDRHELQLIALEQEDDVTLGDRTQLRLKRPRLVTLCHRTRRPDLTTGRRHSDIPATMGDAHLGKALHPR
jgi:hypothetical protein